MTLKCTGYKKIGFFSNRLAIRAPLRISPRRGASRGKLHATWWEETGEGLPLPEERPVTYLQRPSIPGAFALCPGRFPSPLFASPGGQFFSLDCPTVDLGWFELLVVFVEGEVVEGEVVVVEGEVVVVEGEVVVVCEPDPDPPPAPEPPPVPAAKARAAVPSTKVPASVIVRRCFIYKRLL